MNSKIYVSIIVLIAASPIEAAEILRQSSVTAKSENAAVSLHETKAEEFEYVVKKGDTLWSISKKSFAYGQGAQWKKLFDQNGQEIKNPDKIFPGMKIKVKAALTGPVGTGFEFKTEKQKEGGWLRRNIKIAPAMGPGPRLAWMDTIGEMRFVNMLIFDDAGNTAVTVNLEQDKTNKLSWKKAWWMDPGTFVDGKVYHQFWDGETLGGNRFAVSSGPDPNVLKPEDLSIFTGEGGLLYFGSFRFVNELPNPNLSEPWAQELLKEHGASQR